MKVTSFRRDQGEQSMIKCPVCDATVVPSEDPVQGELLECPECGSELEILGLDPIVLGEAPQAEEDWGE